MQRHHIIPSVGKQNQKFWLKGLPKTYYVLWNVNSQDDQVDQLAWSDKQMNYVKGLRSELQQCVQNVNWLYRVLTSTECHRVSNWVKWLKSCCALLGHVKPFHAWHNVTEILHLSLSWSFTCDGKNGSQVVTFFWLSASDLWSIRRSAGGTGISWTHCRYIKTLLTALKIVLGKQNLPLFQLF